MLACDLDMFPQQRSRVIGRGSQRTTRSRDWAGSSNNVFLLVAEVLNQRSRVIGWVPQTRAYYGCDWMGSSNNARL